MNADRRTATIDRDALQLIFDRLYEKVLRRTEDEKHSAERHQRRAIDTLRSKIKHLDPPVRSTDDWNKDVRSRVEKTEEYRALETDDLRKAAFEKVIRRLKEKEEDAEKERERDRDRRRDGHPHPSHREDRPDYRNGHSTASYRDRRATSGRLSHSPEPDAYEADRRKAMADREKSYRKASGTTGLSPPPPVIRDRRDERDRDRSRPDRHRSPRHASEGGRLSHYDRERREREEERERLYRTRGDPRGSRDELDYGAGGGESRSATGSERRRRRGEGSDGESVGSGLREPKRYRKDGLRSPPRPISKGKEKSPLPKKVESLANVHSGSEEGEIEED